MFAAHRSSYGTQQLGFPRIGQTPIGNPQDYYNHIAYYAKFDFILMGMYAGWAGNATYPTDKAVFNAIKAINPKILIGNYSYFLTPWLNSDAAYINSQVGPNGIGDWNLYDNTGTILSGDHANTSLLVTPDANGDRWPQYCAKTRVGLSWTSGGAHRSGPPFDVWFMDNVNYQCRVAADWNRDGVSDAVGSTNARTWWRQGYNAYLNAASALRPATQTILVNTDSDLTGYPNQPAGSFNDYQHIVGGGLLESLIGETFSVDTYAGWTTMMNWYHQTFANLVAPYMVVFGSSSWNATDYKTGRYGLAACLMNNGYYVLNSSYAATDATWLDEYDLAATSTTKWLGSAIDPPQKTAWSNGVYMRRFTGGLALVNPKSNGSQTVTPPSGYTRFTGTQDATTNNGAAVTGTVTLADRDALLLVKTGTNGH